MRKLFHAECPDMLGVPKGDIVVDGLADLRNMIKAGIEDVYIERKEYHDPVWGNFSLRQCCCTATSHTQQLFNHRHCKLLRGLTLFATR